MCLVVAPYKTIHQIMVGTAGRPLLFGDEVMEPYHGTVGHMAGGRAHRFSLLINSLINF